MMIRLAMVIAALFWADASRAEELVKRHGVWAQTYVDRPADPHLRFGQLPNGMRYAIGHSDTPVDHTSLRLLIASGSLSEHDDQQGLAHFTEHMAFRGSAHLPSGDVVRILQRLGLGFGADTNAHTGLDETVYQFDLPHSEPEIFATGVSLLREIASELTLDPSEMDPERGVVLAEERVGDTPARRSGMAQFAFQLEGQRAPLRLPIGKVEVLRTAPVSRLRDFYEAEYRPENATFVAVGAFDVDAMEQMIRAWFSDWTAKTPQHARPDLGVVQKRGAAVRVVTSPGTPPILAVSFVSPPDLTADSRVRARRDVADLIVQGVLNNRLRRMAQGGETQGDQGDKAPFLFATASRSDVMRSATVTEINVQMKPDAWQAALEAVVLAQRGLAEFGPRADEIARAVTQIDTQLRVAADGVKTRSSKEIADAVVRSAKMDEVASNPVQDLAEVSEMIPTLTPDEITAAVRRLFSGSGPLVFLAGADAVPDGEAAVSAVLTAAMGRPVAAEVAGDELRWPYTRSTPGAIAQQGRIEDLGVTDVRFANGVRLLAKQTDFARDEVAIWVRIGQGRLGVTPDKAASSWMVSGLIPLLVAGGTKELSQEDIQRLTAANRLSVRESMGDDAFLLTGTTRPADLDRQLELMQAYTVAPGLRASAMARVGAAILNRLPQIEASASGVFSRSVKPLLHGGDLRFRDFPDEAALKAFAPEQIKSLIGADFASGPIEVTMVGDITPERAIAAVASSYGALPARPARLPNGAAAETVRFPPDTGATPMVLSHRGRLDQAVAMVAWPTEDFFANPQEQRAIATLAAVLQLRITDRLRVAQGLSYSPSVQSSSSSVFKGWGAIEAVAELPADKIAVFFTELDAIAAELRDTALGEDEMIRAKRPRIDQRIQAQRTNAYWVSALSQAHGDVRQFDAIRHLVPGSEQVTGADVQAAARRFLVPGGGFRLVVTPKTP